MAEAQSFEIWDYIIFALFLCISIGVGIYFMYKSWKVKKLQRTETKATLEYQLGGRNMPTIPVALSLLTTFLSGVTMLGTPSEIYTRGILFWIYYLMGAVAFAVSGLFFIPIFYDMKPVSIYQYFEIRFGTVWLRKLAACVFLLHATFYMAVVLYSPAVAISGVSGTAEWIWILIIGCVCTLYTTIGGLKAVVWTDTLQAAFMYLGVAIMIIKGVSDSGGIERVWQVFSDTRRFQPFTYWDLNPLQHNSMWISIFGAFSFWMSLYGLNQMAIQRYCSLPSLKAGRIVLLVTVPAFVVLGSTACFIGMVMVAYFYGDCDPLDTAEYKSDQLVIVYAVRTLRSVPCLPGLFLACLFSATLSTFSSGMNSQAAVLWEDFFKPVMGHKANDNQTQKLNMLFVLCFGVVAMCLAFLAPSLGGIIGASFSLMGGVAGPLVGLFFLGVFNHKASTKGAVFGITLSIAISLTICLGGFIEKPYSRYRLPANDTCFNYTGLADWQDSRNDVARYGNPDTLFFSRISSYLWPFIGIFVVMLFGSLASLVLQDEDVNEGDRLKRLSMTFYGRWQGLAFSQLQCDDNNGKKPDDLGLELDLQEPTAAAYNRVGDASRQSAPVSRPPHYCGGCGSKLGATAAFCGACGRAVNY